MSFFNDFQCVEQGRCHRDRRSVLVVVKHRNFHALAQLTFDIEAVWGLDVFEVDCAKRGLQRRDDLDQLLGILLIDLDVENIDASEVLEQNRLALHHGLGCQRADVAKSQHCGSIADDRHQVAACGVLERIARVFHDLFAWSSHTRGIGQREIVLINHLLGGDHSQLSRRRKRVVVECGLSFVVGCVVGHGYRSVGCVRWESDASPASPGGLAGGVNESVCLDAVVRLLSPCLTSASRQWGSWNALIQPAATSGAGGSVGVFKVVGQVRR